MAECWLMFMESCESIIRGKRRGRRVRETINLAVSVEAFPTAPSDSIETGSAEEGIGCRKVGYFHYKMVNLLLIAKACS